MTDDTQGRLREQVRERYAQAALVVMGQSPDASAGCCGSSAADSCCGSGSAALDSADAFGGPLYGEGETDGLPDEAVLAEMFRVLVPGGRIGISDVVADDHLSAADRAAAGSYAGCVAGALSRSEYLDGLAAVGFTDASVTFTTEAASGIHSTIIRAVKPAR